MGCKNQNECNMGNDCFRKLPNAENCTCGWTNPVWVKELEKKLAIAKEALKEVEDYGYKPNDKESVEIWRFAHEALKKIEEGKK